MTSKSIRKDNSLGTSAIRLRQDMKQTHGKYSDYVSELAVYAKSDLKPIVKAIEKNKLKNGVLKQVEEIFDKIENTLLEIEDTHSEMDEIIQVIGGLEFSTSNIIDKFADIIRDQELQQARMQTDVSHIRTSLEVLKSGNKKIVEDLKENIQDFQESFSRYQDYVIASIPRMTKVFDELDNEEKVGLKYGKTNHI